MRTLARFPLLCFLISCHPAPERPVVAGLPVATEATTASTSSAAPPVSPDGRLPTTVVPEHYQLTFTIDPKSNAFSGEVQIAFRSEFAVRHIVLHALDLKFTSIEVRQPSTDKTSHAIRGNGTPRKSGSQSADEWVLNFDESIMPGRGTLIIRYEGAFATDLASLYTVKRGAESYAFTQFEATDARRAFPCFDEPSFKTPYDITVRTPKGNLAFSNAPIRTTTNQADANQTEFQFKTTKPLPTYLVALAVGPFDVATGPAATIQQRMIAPKGQASAGAAALKASTALVDTLAEYTRTPYPYEKLDLVAVPEFSAGAMENAGLITFREERVLLDAVRLPKRSIHSMEMILAHELAHQWTGDFVTASYWNELWLNEGFASFLESKSVDLLHHDNAETLSARLDSADVMNSEAFNATRAVREPSKTTADAMDAFDAITYTKGAALLRMTEDYMGSDAFRAGITKYLLTHAHSNATTADLYSAFDEAYAQSSTGAWRQGGPAPSAIMLPFLTKPGVPVIDLNVACTRSPSGKASARISLAEHSYHPRGAAGARAPADGGRADFAVPICVAHPQGSYCTIVDATHPGHTDVSYCPAWVEPQASHDGYFRFTLPPHAWLAAARKPAQNEVSRALLLGSALSAYREGGISGTALLEIIASFDDDMNPLLTAAVATALRELSFTVVGKESNSRFARFCRDRLQKRAAFFHLRAPGDDSQQVIDARRAVLLAMVDLGGVRSIREAAVSLAQKWLHDRTSVDSDLAYLSLELAARSNGATYQTQLLAALKAPGTPQDLVVLIRALGGFSDMHLLQKSWNGLLDGTISVQHARYVLQAALLRPETRADLLTWVLMHEAELRKAFPGAQMTHLTVVADGLCSPRAPEGATARLHAIFDSVEGAKRPLDQALERVALCKSQLDPAPGAPSQPLF